MKYQIVKGLRPTSDYEFCDEDEKVFVSLRILEPELFRFRVFTAAQKGPESTWTVSGPGKDVPWQGRRYEDRTPFSNPPVEIKKSKDEYQYITSKIKISVRLDPLSVVVTDLEDREIFRDLDEKAYSFSSSGSRAWHFQKRNEKERFFGLGEKTGRLNRLHRRYRMHNTDAMGYDAQYSDPLYKHWPFMIVWNGASKSSYGMFYDQYADSVFDIGSEVNNYFGPYRYYQTSAGYLEYYFFNGPTIPETISRFMNLTGRTVLPPRWMLGFLGSTMNYTEAFNAEEQLVGFLDSCEKNKIPCDGFHLSSGYSLFEGKRYVFNWNPTKIEDPKKLAHAFKEKGQHLIVNVKPCLLEDHPSFEEVKSKGLFIGQHQEKKSEEKAPYLVPFWGGNGAFLDFTHPMAVAWWKRKIKDQVLAYDMAGVWNDNNEFDSPEDEVKCENFGRPELFSQLRPVHSLLMTRASTEAQEEHSPDMRPSQITRAGCPGIQRYASTWSGDNYSSWKALKYSIPIGMSMSISGMFNFGHDIGGFAGPMPSPELLIRWVQAGIFLPRFTMHSWNPEGPATEPWMYPEALPHIRKSIEMRYEYIPYIYSLLYYAHLKHKPMVRPLFYDYPYDEKSFLRDFEFLCGPFMLVAPIYKRDDNIRQVYLPQGKWKWWDTINKKWYDGGQTVSIVAEIDQLPIFIREGAIIPTSPNAKTSNASPRTILVYPGPNSGDSSFDHYEDDGASTKYLKGEFEHTSFKLKWNAQSWDLESSRKDQASYVVKSETR